MVDQPARSPRLQLVGGSAHNPAGFAIKRERGKRLAAEAANIAEREARIAAEARSAIDRQSVRVLVRALQTLEQLGDANVDTIIRNSHGGTWADASEWWARLVDDADRKD